MKICRMFVATFLATLLAFGWAPSVYAQQQEPTKSRVPFKFTDPPAPKYYFRSFDAGCTGPARDLREENSDEVIRSNPQSHNGFLTRWLQPGQAVDAVTEPTEVVMCDANGKLSRVTLQPGEAVVYDSTTHEILAVVRCANKVVEGRVRLPEPPQPIELPCRPKAAPDVSEETLPDGTKVTILDDGCTKTVTKVVPGPEVEKLVNPCEQDWWKNRTRGEIGAYDFKDKGAKKVEVSELLDGRWDHHHKMNRGQFEFWSPLAREVVKGREVRTAAVEFVRTQMDDLYESKVNHLVLNYDWCTDTLYVDAYSEAWHWKEFILGFIAGFALGYWVRGGGGPTKAPFIQRPNVGRPTTSTGWIVVRP